MKAIIRRLMIVTGIGLATGALTGAAEYYVATTGTGVGTSWAAAFTNVQDAFDVADANDTIYVAGGDYVLTNQLVWPTVSGVTLRGGYEGVGAPGSNNPALWPTRFTCHSDYEIRILAIENVTNGRLERVTLSDGRLVTPQFKGGNLYMLNVTDFTLSNVLIQHASARSTANGQSFFGGGVAMEQCAGIVFDACAIEDNRLTGTHYGGNQRGAGLYALDSSFLLTNSSVRLNKSHYAAPSAIRYARGGGLYVEGGAALLIDTLIAGNQAWSGGNLSYSGARGGGVYFLGGMHTLRNCLIAGNKNYASDHGSSNRQRGDGIYAEDTTLTLDNCTVAHNFGQGIYAHSDATATLTHCIVWGNLFETAGDGTIVMTHSFVGDGSNDPLFERGFYLGDDSPCVNAGSVTAASLGLDGYTTRADGTPDTGMVDMGYHHAAGMDPARADLYVSPAGSDSNPAHDGTGWDKAFRTIRKALSVAADGSHIHLAAGSYNRAAGETFPLIMDRFGMRLTGTNAAQTVISAGSDFARVLTVESVVGSRGRIQGLTFRDGHRPAGNEIEGRGSGIAMFGSLIDIVDCEIRNNYNWEKEGGGLYLESSPIVVSNSVIAANQVSRYYRALGGGIYVAGDGPVEIVDCLIKDNIAHANNARSTVSADGGRGAGIYLAGFGYERQALRRIERCVITDNGATHRFNWAETMDWRGRGVGLYHNGGETILRNSVIAGSWVGKDAWSPPALIYTNMIEGGAVYATSGTDGLPVNLTIENCTFATNSNQGLFLTPDDAGFLVRNTIIWGHADDIGNVAEARLWHSCASNLTPDVQGNINADPLFVDADGGDYRLVRSVDLISPAINCGQNQLWMIGAIDLEGNRRVLEGRVDMGVYESIPPRGTLIMIR